MSSNSDSPTPARRRSGLPEQFHVNTVTVIGTIARVWSAESDVFFRLKDAHDPAVSVTVRLPGGQLQGGGAISLLTKSRVRVTGFLREVPFTETLPEIFTRAGLPHLIQEDDQTRVLKRVSTVLIAEQCQPVEPADPPQSLNTAQIEGLVTRAWITRAGEVCARLAVYDRHAERRGEGRQAHYVAVRVPTGHTLDGQPVRFELRQRVLVTSGYLLDISYTETLQMVLNKATPPRPTPLPPDLALDRRVLRRSALYVAARTLIVFSK